MQTWLKHDSSAIKWGSKKDTYGVARFNRALPKTKTHFDFGFFFSNKKLSDLN